MNYLVRGILIGGSVGILFGLLLDMHLGRALALGMLAGFLSGATLAQRAKRRNENNK